MYCSFLDDLLVMRRCNGDVLVHAWMTERECQKMNVKYLVSVLFCGEHCVGVIFINESFANCELLWLSVGGVLAGGINVMTL